MRRDRTFLRWLVEIGPDALDVQFLLVGDVTSPAASAPEVIAFRTPLGWRVSGQPITRLSIST